MAASINYRIAIGPRAGRKALTLFNVPPSEDSSDSSLMARLAGFTLHVVQGPPGSDLRPPILA
jgi:hypothetical protein